MARRQGHSGLLFDDAATQPEMEAGTEAAIRSMSPLRVAQAIAALEPIFYFDATHSRFTTGVFALQAADGSSRLVLDVDFGGIDDGGAESMSVDVSDGMARILATNGLVIPLRSGDPSGERGQVFYDYGTEKWRAYENGAWVDMIGGGSSHTHVYSEVPSGTVNGSNDTFTLAATPTSGTLRLYKNGLRQKAGAGNDYTLATATITFLTGNIPQTGDNLLADYET